MLSTQCATVLKSSARTAIVAHGRAGSLLAYAFCLLVVTHTGYAHADAWVTRMLVTRDHDFGTIASGSTAQYRFAVKNPYPHDIELTRVRSSCGCTTAQLENTRLRRGETGYIRADFNTRAFSGPHESTLTLEAIWHDHGVPRTGEASLTVRGVIRGRITVEPAEINFPDVAVGEAAAQNVRVTAHGQPQWQLHCVQCSTDSLNVDMSEPKRAPEQVIYDMLVHLGTHLPAGRFREQLTVVPAVDAEPKIPIDVTGRVVPAVWAAPEVLFLGEVPVASHVVKKLVVRSQKPCRVIAVRFERDNLAFRTNNLCPLRQVITIDVPTGTKNGSWQKTITIATESGPSVTITAFATIIPAAQTASVTHP